MALTANTDLAEYLGVEVVQGPGSGVPVLRWRVVGEAGQHNHWKAKEASATDVVLWDALRAMHVMRLGADSEAETLRDVADAVRRELLRERSMPRLTPKGGDRGEFARQVRRLAKIGLQKVSDAQEHGNPDDYHVAAGGVAMANRVLVMLDEHPVLEGGVVGEVLERQPLVDSLTRVRGAVAKWADVSRDSGTQLLALDRVLALLAGEVVVDEMGNWVDVPKKEE
jgi:hypothetical protein